MRRTQLATVYHTDGTVTEHRPANKREFTLQELQRMVGGYLESLVPANKKIKQMYADEEGLLKRLSPNPHTAALCDMRCYVMLNGYAPDWCVVGPIVTVTKEYAQ